MQEALKQERELLRPARDQADYIIDTSLLQRSAAQRAGGGAVSKGKERENADYLHLFWL